METIAYEPQPAGASHDPDPQRAADAPPAAAAAPRTRAFPFTTFVDWVLVSSGVSGVLGSYAQRQEWWDEARTVPLAAMVFTFGVIYRGLSLTALVSPEGSRPA